MRLIEVPQWGNVTLIEAVWLCSGLLAFTLAILRLPLLWRDARAARRVREKDLYVLARGYLRRELVRIWQALTIIIIGFYASVQPPAIPGPARISVTGLILTGGLLALGLLVALQSFLDWRDRAEVKRILE